MRVVNLEQGTPQWHEFRRAGIGGSDAPVVEGSSPYTTPRQLYLVKRGEVEEEGGNEFIFAQGHKTEALVRKEFAALTGAEMLPLCLIHSEHDYMRASLDGFDGKKYGVLEAKLVGKAVLEDARDEGAIPRHHFVQLQHNMEVAGVDLGQWYGHDGKTNGILIEIKRDKKFIREQMQREADFWGMVQSGQLPPLTLRDIMIPEDLAILNELREAKEFLDNAQANFDAVKEKLDTYGHPRLRGAGIVANKVSRSGTLDVKKIPGVRSLLDSYTERYMEKFRGTASKPSWTISLEKKVK